jgi:HlyD family secretion protein
MNQSSLEPTRSRFLPILLILVVVGCAVVGGSAYTQGYFTPVVEDPFDHALTYKVIRSDMAINVTELGSLESSDNTQIVCRVRGQNTITSVVESGTYVKKGDIILTLDTLYIDEQISERSKYAHWSKAGAKHWLSRMTRAKLSIPEYLEGRYVASLMGMEKDLAITESRLRTSQNMLAHTKMLQERGYVSELDVEQREFNVTTGKLSVENQETQIEVLKKFSKARELERLEGQLKIAKAQFGANDERADADASRRDRAIEEREYCTISAPKDGLVIHPRAAAWKDAPDVTEGGTVYKEQVLLLMPDLDKMQVKVGVHEAVVSEIKTGLPTRITLPNREPVVAEVSYVADIARPPSLGSGDVIKYDVVVELPPLTDLKPGMSAEIEIVLSEHKNVMLLPVAAVLELDDGFHCWVKAGVNVVKRVIKLGDSNDIFVVVKDGVKEGEDVILNPLAYIGDAQKAVLVPFNDNISDEKRDAPDTSNSQIENQAAGTGA